MLDLTKRHYVSNKENFTKNYLEELYRDKLVIDGFPIYTNYPERLANVLRFNRFNFNEVIREAKIGSKKPYAAMQYQLMTDYYNTVAIAFLTEKSPYCYVYNVKDPMFSEAGCVDLMNVAYTAKRPF